MKILFVALDFKPALGGVSEFTHQLAKNLQTQGNKVAVAAQEMPGAADFDAVSSYRIQRYDFIAKRKQGWSGYGARFSYLRTALKDHQADILISNAVRSEVFLCRLLARRAHIPFCVFAYGRELSAFSKASGTWPSMRRRLITLPALRNSSQVFCVSRYTQQLVQELGVSREKTALLLPGIDAGAFDTTVDVAEFKRTMGWENRTVLLTVGRLVERKGMDSVIRSLPLVIPKMPNVLYVICGEGPFNARLEQLVLEMGLAAHVFFAGRIQSEDRDLFYGAADVFVMPNRQLVDGDVEGFGIVFLEASVHGKPVIGGLSGGAVDAIEHGVSGLLVPPDNVDELASAIVRLLQDRAYAQRLGMQGRERVLASFSWPQAASRLEAQLSRLLPHS